MPVEPETAKFLERVRALPFGRPGPGVSVDEARRGTAATAEWGRPGPEVALTVNSRIPVAGGEIELRVLSPDRPMATVVYVHGGGWVLGHIDGFDAFARVVANSASVAVALINYRKAPEHPFQIGRAHV